MVSEELSLLPTIETPPAGEARVLLVPATAERASAARSFLCAEELEDIDRLARESDRDEAAVSRCIWRQAAGGAMGIPPEQVGVERTSYGRPLPVGLERTRFDLSVTHSGGLVGLAVGHGVRVGLDLERVTGASIEDHVEASIEGVRGPAVDLVPDRTERILLAWCVVEALLKADGRGLHLNPSMVTAEIRTLWGWNMAKVAGNGWWVRRVPAPAGYIGALAANAPVEPLTSETLS
jgi:phosphopantetheinyl transferase